MKGAYNSDQYIHCETREIQTFQKERKNEKRIMEEVSGFVVSKPAGERLLRMVKYILETDEPKTFLDYREFEPNWIQFKFSAEEFDVEKLDQMAKANGNIITEQIVRQCVKSRKEE